MSTFVLIPGADGRAWYWHRIVPLLQELGHEVVPVDLPEQASAGLDDYAGAVVAAIGRRTGLVVVGQSLGGFTAPLVCDRVPVDLMVLVNAMVPAPGEAAGQWWSATGHADVRAAQAVAEGRDPGAGVDLLADFFHDVPPEITSAAMSAGPGVELDGVFAQPWPLERWPDVPTVFLQGRDDRFFPIGFQRRVVAERLGLPVEELPGGHLIALSRPVELAAALQAHVQRLSPAG
jgi:pimeloyl-ACP methyl ester carboxylesterase